MCDSDHCKRQAVSKLEIKHSCLWSNLLHVMKRLRHQLGNSLFILNEYS